MHNILVIAKDFYPNSTGFANATVNLINALNKNAKDIQIFVSSDTPLNGQKEFDGAVVYRSSYARIMHSFLRYREICEIVEKNNIDFILFETDTFPLMQNFVVNKYGNKVAVRIHSTADTEVMRFRYARGKLSERLAYCSASSFINKCKTIISTNTYHQHFIDHHFLNDDVYRIWGKNRFILPNTMEPNVAPSCVGGYFFSLGKMSYDGYLQKGLPDLLFAVYLLKQKREDIYLRIVGDGDSFSLVQNMVEKLQLTPNVQLIKKLSHDEVLAQIANCRAVCLVSRYEGQSMFATEAIAMGKPVIITTDNGMNDMVEPGVNGYSVRTGDVADIAEKMNRILNMTDDQLRIMGEESEKLFREKFSMETVAQLMETMLSILFATEA